MVVKKTVSRLLSLIRLRRTLRLVWQISPGWTLASVVLVLFRGVLPLASLWVTRHVVDEVAQALQASGASTGFTSVIGWVALAAGVAVLAALLRAAGEVVNQAQSALVVDRVSSILHKQSVAVDLEYYETPEYYDTLHRAQNEARYRVGRALTGLLQIGQAAISLIGTAGLLATFDWRVAGVLVVGVIPAALVRATYSRRLHRLEQQHVEGDRRAWYYSWMMTSPHYAKEVRLFGTGNVFQARYDELRRQLREARLGLGRRRALASLVVQLASSATVFGALALVAYQTLAGEATIGGLVMYYQAYQVALGQLRGILTALTGLYEDSVFLSDLYRFLDLDPKITVKPDPADVPKPAQQAIVFHDVSFAYSGCDSMAVDGADFEVRPGEVIALVGANGAGKTTLIKLLCRLYDPCRGQITVDGVDLCNLDPVSWRKQISVIFQDFAHYNLSLRENIWLGDVDADPEGDRVMTAARLSGADSLCDKLPRGYETFLGHYFADGHELSIGEWQKVALARAFIREGGIVVLDEPTSALDAIAEAELFGHFRRLLAGRSAIVISHRFSTVHMADRIYVLDEGRIVEGGTHKELIEKNGLYARMYNAQAGLYRDGVPSGVSETPADTR